MSIFTLPGGVTVVPGNPFEFDGNLYPANWLQLASPAEREAIGLVEIVETERPDDRFYFINAHPTKPGQWQTAPKDLDQIKAMLVRQVKATVSAVLTQTDWMVIRAIEGGDPIGAATAAFRSAMRAAGNDMVSEIAELTFNKAVMWQPHDWPEAT